MKAKALLVAINDYPNESGLARLSFAEADARDLADRLERLYGFEVTKLLGKEASRDAIEAAASAIGKGGIYWFFFAGHGQMIRGQYHLFPYNSLAGGLRAISFHSLHEIWHDPAFGYSQVFVVLDACRNEAAGIRGARAFSASEARDVVAATQGRRRVEVLYGCQEGQVSFEPQSLRHGLLTYALLGVLDEPRPYLDTVTLAGAAADRMKAWSDADPEKRYQVAHLYAVPSLEDKIVLRRSSAPPPPPRIPPKNHHTLDHPAPRPDPEPLPPVDSPIRADRRAAKPPAWGIVLALVAGLLLLAFGYAAFRTAAPERHAAVFAWLREAFSDRDGELAPPYKPPVEPERTPEVIHLERSPKEEEVPPVDVDRIEPEQADVQAPEAPIFVPEVGDLRIAIDGSPAAKEWLAQIAISVTLDGVPLEIPSFPHVEDNLAAGPRTVRFEARGFSPVEMIREVRDGQVAELTLPLRPLPARLTVYSEPVEAEVFRGDTLLGLTGTELTVPGLERLELEIRAPPGWQTTRLEVDPLNPGGMNHHTVRLERSPVPASNGDQTADVSKPSHPVVPEEPSPPPIVSTQPRILLVPVQMEGGGRGRTGARSSPQWATHLVAEIEERLIKDLDPGKVVVYAAELQPGGRAAKGDRIVVATIVNAAENRIQSTHYGASLDATRVDATIRLKVLDAASRDPLWTRSINGTKTMSTQPFRNRPPEWIARELVAAVFPDDSVLQEMRQHLMPP